VAGRFRPGQKAPTPANPQQGIIAGGGTVYSFDPNAANPTSTMRLEAWGFRNPYGIGFDPFNENQLFVSNNGADVRQTTINGVITIRGSRPIDNDYDDMFVVQIGQGVKFFGHPDFFHDPVTRQPLPVTNPLFCPPPRALPVPPPHTALAVLAIRLFRPISGYADGPAGLRGNRTALLGQYVRFLSQCGFRLPG
jgi:hypothetical protein